MYRNRINGNNINRGNLLKRGEKQKRSIDENEI